MEQQVSVKLSTEALAAVTGVYPDDPATVADGVAAGLIHGKWRTAIKQFFDKDRPSKFKKNRLPASYETMSKKILVGDDDPVWLTQNMVDPDMIRAYTMVISNARLYIRERWPNLQIDNFAGPQTVEPGKVFVSEATMVFCTVNDPSIILDEMLSHSLIPQQAECFKTCYPSLFGMLDELIEERKILELTRAKSWKCPWSKERVLRNLFGMPPTVSIAEAPKPKAQMGSIQEIKFKATSEITRGQKLESA